MPDQPPRSHAPSLATAPPAPDGQLPQAPPRWTARSAPGVTALLIVTGMATGLGTAAAASDDPSFEAEWAERAGTPSGSQPGDERPAKADLTYLADDDRRRVHEHDNRLHITATSLETGWVDIEQCHRGLGPMPNGVILFRADKTRGLEITHRSAIDIAETRDDRVIVRNAGANAELCVALEMQILDAVAPGRWTLSNGPFQRRFLDGYYPMQVRIDVDWAGLDLVLTEARPPGAEERIVHRDDGFTFEARFEGVLRTAFDLEAASPADAAGADRPQAHWFDDAQSDDQRLARRHAPR